MQTILKTFRIPSNFARFLEKKAKKRHISQTEMLLKIIESNMEQEKEWQQGLEILAKDKEYRKEQVALAEENYE